MANEVNSSLKWVLLVAIGGIAVLTVYIMVT